jgi:hypothetical protein
MTDIIKENIKDENYIQTLIKRVELQRNEALNTVFVLETEMLKANSIINSLSEENKKLKSELEDLKTTKDL